MDAEKYIQASHELCIEQHKTGKGCSGCIAFGYTEYACKLHHASNTSPEEKIKIIEDFLGRTGGQAFHCGVEESGGHAYNCNDCPNKCDEWYQWDKEFKEKGDKV